tara:strand:+ start:3265 stop:3756 length:492 start_codon:yes stop_codon:yes gene_type:complete
MRKLKMSKIPMTTRGVILLQDELKKLKSQDRPDVIAAISEARAHGDLKENAEYHAAKEQQGFIEGRIKEIESKLSNVQEIDVTIINAGGKVVFGSTVTLIDLQNNDEITYKIVGEDEADIKSNLISYSSPIARAIIGKFEGDDVVFQAPGGEREYEVVSVEYL